MQRKDRKVIMEQIKHDIRFLGKTGIMDYSLLVIIETNPKW